MQSAISLKITSTAAIQMQAQLSNLIAIQNLQEYLKYLILTTSIEPQAMKVHEKPAEQLTDQSSPLKQETDMIIEDEESEIVCHKKKQLTLHSDSLSKYFSARRKKSQKLFSLMQKRYNGPKASQRCEETIEGSQQDQEKSKSIIPMIKKSFKEKQVVCGHPWRDHYAKGLCGTCYLKFGRTKKPWNCSHEKLYALGLCQKCYAAKYNMKKKSCEPEEACNQIKTETLDMPNTCQDHVLIKEAMEQENIQTGTRELLVKIEPQN